ncbi:MAG: ABC transporter ATP-binding protein [Bacillota bacterium]|nr:ABC transporter ATP-binding protein [Bacillota bacterium]
MAETDRVKVKRRELTETFLEGKNMSKVYGMGRRANRAVDNVNFKFRRGEIVSIVGESGSGKTTLAKMILGLTSITEGQLELYGQPRAFGTTAEKREYWKNIQAIFQDPFSTYNVFSKIDKVLLNCIELRGQKDLPYAQKVEIMTEACSFVNLRFAELTNKYPFELSGGQMQRLMIARIYILKPKLLIADEPTSMVDACSRATILDMLLKLRDEEDMTIVFITHDIGLAYYVSDTIYIMKSGQFVEQGTSDEVILHPKSDYTKRLLSDVPSIYEPWDLTSDDLLSEEDEFPTAAGGAP